MIFLNYTIYNIYEMRKNEKMYLLLDYIQNMYFRSIEEILYFCTFNLKNEGRKINVYQPESIDEYNRIITDGNVDDLVELKIKLESFGINTSIGNLDDNEFSKKRSYYIKYKFPNEVEEDVLKNIKNNYLNKNKSIWRYEPIIIEVENNGKITNQKIIFIMYKQFIKWDALVSRLENIVHTINKRKSKHNKLNFNENTINKYNRIFYHSTNTKEIQKILLLLKKNNINFVVLDNEDDFIPYRIEYIVNYYGPEKASYYQSKWRFEYENNWYNKEKWDPIILIKNKHV